MRRPKAELAGPHLCLRSPGEADLPELHHLVNRPDIAPLWRHQGRTVGPEEFTRTLWDGTFANFVARQSVDGRLAGSALAYNLNLRDGHGAFATVIAPELHGTGLVLEALGLLLGYCFEHWPLRRMYAELREDRFLEVASGTDRYFRIEGCLSEHAYLGGTYVDQYLVVVTRDHYRQLVEVLGHRYLSPAAAS